MGKGSAWCARYTVNVEIQAGSLPVLPAKFKGAYSYGNICLLARIASMPWIRVDDFWIDQLHP